MVGEQFRAILEQTGFKMSEFASAIRRSRWFVQRLCRSGERVADRWVVQLALFLERKGLQLDNYYTHTDPKGSPVALVTSTSGSIEPVEESKRSIANKQKPSRKKGTSQHTVSSSRPMREWRRNIQDNVQKIIRDSGPPYQSYREISEASDDKTSKDGNGEEDDDGEEDEADSAALLSACHGPTLLHSLSFIVNQKHYVGLLHQYRWPPLLQMRAGFRKSSFTTCHSTLCL